MKEAYLPLPLRCSIPFDSLTSALWPGSEDRIYVEAALLGCDFDDESVGSPATASETAYRRQELLASSLLQVSAVQL
jgi:hypothetical protein